MSTVIIEIIVRCKIYSGTIIALRQSPLAVKHAWGAVPVLQNALNVRRYASTLAILRMRQAGQARLMLGPRPGPTIGQALPDALGLRLSGSRRIGAPQNGNLVAWRASCENFCSHSPVGWWDRSGPKIKRLITTVPPRISIPIVQTEAPATHKS